MKKIKYLGAILLIQTLPFIASAAIPDPGLTKPKILDLLSSTLNWVDAAIFIIGILVVLYVAFLYMTAAGDEEKIAKAKRTFIYGLVGIGIAILAFGIWQLVASFLTPT